MARHRTLHTHDVDHPSRTRSTDTHRTTEVGPRRPADEGVVMPGAQVARRIRRAWPGIYRCLRSKVLDHTVVPVVTLLMSKHNEMIGHRSRLVRHHQAL